MPHLLECLLDPVNPYEHPEHIELLLLTLISSLSNQ